MNKVMTCAEWRKKYPDADVPVDLIESARERGLDVCGRPIPGWSEAVVKAWSQGYWARTLGSRRPIVPAPYNTDRSGWGLAKQWTAGWIAANIGQPLTPEEKQIVAPFKPLPPLPPAPPSRVWKWAYKAIRALAYWVIALFSLAIGHPWCAAGVLAWWSFIGYRERAKDEIKAVIRAEVEAAVRAAQN